jgi:resolvase-like protein
MHSSGAKTLVFAVLHCAVVHPAFFKNFWSPRVKAKDLSMKIGYVQVSTNGQDLRLQLDALHGAGCEKIYEERASGAKVDRPVLEEVLPCLKKRGRTDRLAAGSSGPGVAAFGGFRTTRRSVFIAA